MTSTDTTTTTTFEADEVEEQASLENTFITGYRLAQLVNECLVARGEEASFRPQMVYRYISEGRIKTEERGGKNLIRADVAIQWAKEYLLGRTAQQKLVTVAQLNLADQLQQSLDMVNEGSPVHEVA
jgi:hypothetical protein